MNFAASIANDIALVMDQLETITITLVRASMGGTGITETVTIANANRSVMSRQIANYAEVQLEDDQIPFYFPANEFVPVNNPQDIRNRDLITDANGIQYYVQSATLMVLETVWLVVAKRKTP